MEEVKIRGVKIRYNKDWITIVDSWKIQDESDMRLILLRFKGKSPFAYKRTMESWIREWKAHNRLYKLGLFRSHTKDCDFDESEKWYRRLAYWIIGF